MIPEALPRILAQAGPVFGALLSGVEHRGRLAKIEAAEARSHAAITFAAGIVVIFFALLGAMLTAFTAAALVWTSEHRIILLAGLAMTALATAALSALLLRKRIRNWSPFMDTRDQLREDVECMRSLFAGLEGK